MFKVVLETLLIFLNSCFFILLQLNVYFFLLLQIIDLSPGFFLFTVGSLYIFLYFTFHSLHFFPLICNHTQPFLWASWLPLFWTLHLIRLAISSTLSCISFDLFFHLGHFFFVLAACYVVRDEALGICQGGPTHIAVLWSCVWGRGQRGNNATCSALGRLKSLPPLSIRKLGTSGSNFQVGGFVYVLWLCGSLQWTLLWGWEFLLPPQPPYIFLFRGFEDSFPCTGTLGWIVYLVSQLLPSLRSSSHHLATSTLHPGCPSPPILLVWINVSSLSPWLSDFHVFWYSVSLVVFCF